MDESAAPEVPEEVVEMPEAEAPPIAEVAAPAPAALAQIAGVIVPDAHVAAVQVVLTLPDGTQMNTAPDAAGIFTFADLPAGDYIVEAFGARMLTARAAFALAEGQRIDLAAPTLVTGDTNGDNLIDVRDAALIAANFNGPALVPEADLNGDNWIDIRDLSMIGARFGLAGPLPWQ